VYKNDDNNNNNNTCISVAHNKLSSIALTAVQTNLSLVFLQFGMQVRYATVATLEAEKF